jgi:hypothetical protein
MPAIRQVETTSGAGARVVTKALIKAATRLDIPNGVLARIIGVSDTTVSRMRNHDLVIPGDKPFEMAVLFIRLFRSLDALVGGDSDVARVWLRSPNSVIAGPPIETIQTVAGLMNVIAYLDARRALV